MFLASFGRACGLAGALSASAAAAATLERNPEGVVLPVGGQILKIEVCAEDVVRVAHAADRAFFTRPSLAAAPRRCTSPRWELEERAGEAVLSTAKLKVRIDLSSGDVAFLDAAGRPVLVEKKGGRTIAPALVQGDDTHHVGQQWEPQDGEGLYGLGMHHLGLVNLKGHDLDLWQHNGTIAVPFLVSSRGYGIFWDNTSYTRFGDLRQPEAIPAARLFDAEGKPGGLTGSYYAGARFERLVGKRLDPRIEIATPERRNLPNTVIHHDLPPTGDISIRWEGSVQPEATGDHTFSTFSNAGIKVWVDDRLVIDHWRQGWLPWKNVARVRLNAGQRHQLRVEYTKDQEPARMELYWKTPAPDAATSLWSQVGEGTDYYLIYGPALDGVIGGYRRLTGQAPLMPRWAFGLWQSRQRYETAQQSLEVLDGFRSRGIPLDVIVQDWFYWKEAEWGSHAFDPARFPDPAAWIRAIHDKKARVMISVWPKFYPGTDNFRALRAKGYLLEANLGRGIRDWLDHPNTFYDPFNAGARQLFWQQMETALYRKGIDAWWMDASEPDLTPTPTLEVTQAQIHPTALGSGARLLNAYSLVNSQGIYEGQRGADPDQRVFILTRSGFAGQQRYAAASWSGDVSSTWTALKAQLPAGLGLSLSGIPYWTHDVGGFSVPARFSRKDAEAADVEEWRELNVRWFQLGTFTPLLRVHGEFPYREMWFMGGESHPAYQAQLKFDRLRYRLLPYVYSLAGAVTHQAGTITRPLVMDFPADPGSLDVADQFLFGPALLVSPVTDYKARRRPVYLPPAAGWYDFWTGAALPGGRTTDAPAPYDALPVHVRAGSIVPSGPDLQYTDEKPADPITLHVYAGADGAFALYEDDGLSYGYEKGAFSRIPLRWNESRRTLTIGAREGSFPGMLKERTFQVVLVSRARPRGFGLAPKPDQILRYRGEAMTVPLR